MKEPASDYHFSLWGLHFVGFGGAANHASSTPNIAITTPNIAITTVGPRVDHACPRAPTAVFSLFLPNLLPSSPTQHQTLQLHSMFTLHCLWAHCTGLARIKHVGTEPGTIGTIFPRLISKAASKTGRELETGTIGTISLSLFAKTG